VSMDILAARSKLSNLNVCSKSTLKKKIRTWANKNLKYFDFKWYYDRFSPLLSFNRQNRVDILYISF
jgi:hypothetical protein